MSEEMYKSGNLGDASLNKFELLHLMIILSGLILMVLYRVNTVIWEQAEIFFMLGVVSFIVMTFFFLVNTFKGRYEFTMPISDEREFGGIKWRKWLTIISVILFFVTFLGMFASGGTAQGVWGLTATTFSLVNTGFWGALSLDIFAFLFENYFFFVALNMLVFIGGYFLPKIWKGQPSFWLAIILCMILVPLIFTAGHTNIHGGDERSMYVTYLFGLEMTAMQLLWTDVIWSVGRHGGNNLGIAFAKEFGSLGNFLIAMLTNPFVWTFIIIVILILYLRYRNRNNK